MLQRLMAVSLTVFLGCSGLACGQKARSSADAAMGAGTGGTSGAGGALDGGTTDHDAAGGSAGGGGAAGITGAGAGGAAGITGAGGAAGTSNPGGSGGTTGASGRGGEGGVGSGGTGGASGSGGAGGAGGSSDGRDDAGADGGPTDAGVDGPTCTPNVACTPNLPCKTGAVSCDTGVARCVATGNQPNGTLCGTGVFCVMGFCDNEGCGHACTPANRCHTGIISCTTGTNICQDTGASVPDGTNCGTDQTCKSGVCGG